jgi:hypothetical protein
MAFELFHATSASASESVSMRQTWDHRIRPEAFMALAPGEAWVRANSREGAWQLRLPRIDPPAGPGFRLTPVSPAPVQGREGIGPRLAAREIA